jgi:hypothetical protein
MSYLSRRLRINLKYVTMLDDSILFADLIERQLFCRLVGVRGAFYESVESAHWKQQKNVLKCYIDESDNRDWLVFKPM